MFTYVYMCIYKVYIIIKNFVQSKIIFRDILSSSLQNDIIFLVFAG